MKKLFFTLFATSLLALSANAQSKFTRMELPASRQAPAGPSETIVYEVSFKGNTGKTGTGQIKFVVPDDGNGLIALEITDNVLQSLGINANYLVSASRALAEGSTESQTLSQCLDGCNKKFTTADGVKIKGRGKCKANCWFGSLEEILPAVLTIIKVLG
ncbi:MAG: hypothetical protein CFE23_06780 [Flavobacterium sp. BFFFF1]|uniref:hypothetical protein n=1 Tax=Flavobacterium sp. BFFFF1 TaxID=2015557 RepID=UPI000BD3CB32|nr:hypothetical protein [Flavobacterium sp. BFFFF1]OYU80932.1 MAG: hypothetical protein CFE23_06780 [Flavobacterium sp. BFFFF1]